MRGLKGVLLATVAVIGFTAAAPKAEAQVDVNVGVAPDCPYGYYDVAPYACAPVGYYGQEWFVGGGNLHILAVLGDRAAQSR
jgi:hypothetical protein